MPRYFLDLFAGIGGFALGAYWAEMRFDEHYFSEIDDYAIKVYSMRFPDAIALGDIKQIHGKDLPNGEWIIAGGFPCQDISEAGKGAGLDGARSGLWYEYARIISELRPRYAIMENVGALTFRGLDRVLGSLAEIGYDAEWQDIRASDIGAPHKRERIWIIAYPNQIRRSSILQKINSSGFSETSKTWSSFYMGTLSNSENRDSWGGVYESAILDGYDGISFPMERLECAGNSIVPQIAELIFRSIKIDMDIENDD